MPQLLIRLPVWTRAILLYFIIGHQIALAAEFNSCTAVKSEYNRQGFNDEVPEIPYSGKHLRFCSNAGANGTSELTCCTAAMEHKLSIQSRQRFDNKLKKLLNPFANLLEKKRKKFNDLFTNLISHSRESFDTMFKKTYGILYKQNSNIFFDLFDDLNEYYQTGKKNMQTQMDNFFQLLYQKMFTVFNSQYILSQDYLHCVNSHMQGLMPFGDVPEKLTRNIKRSFIAFRTFVQGLSIGSSIVKNVIKINPSMSCLHELMKMTHCATCSGHLGVKPCLPYCLHVQELCLAHHLPLAEQWTQFVNIMEQLGDRLEGPFNIGNQVDPIDYKISIAIMNFQESGNKITEKVFQGCGNPPLGRSARSTRGELDLQPYDFTSSSSSSHRGSQMQSPSPNEAISKLIREIKTKVKNSKEFWSELPSQMCKEARHHGAANCWTGNQLGKYSGTSLLNLSKSMHSPQMDEQVYKLKVITRKLQEAFNGEDVSWIDQNWLGEKSGRREPQDDGVQEGSGSGWYPGESYSNSAQYPPDDEDGVEEGSGHYNPRIHHSDDDDYDEEEGSGTVITKLDRMPNNNSPYDENVPRLMPPARKPTKPNRENPSAAPAGKPMSLPWAIAVYLVPAVFSFLGSIG